MIDVEVSIKSIEAAKVSEAANADSQVVFNVTASISEGNRTSGEVTLRFNLELKTQPEVARFLVNGSATLRGEESEVDALLAAKEDDSVPVVFMRIYQRVYAVMYLICGTLKLPYPAPGLLKSVHVSTTQNVAQPAGQPQSAGGLSV